jgi:hypothetical protein
MRLPTQSPLIPKKLWLAARVVERIAVGLDDDAEANGAAARYLLDPDHLEHDIAHGRIDVRDPLLALAVEIIREHTTDGNPLMRVLPSVPASPRIPYPDLTLPAIQHDPDGADDDPRE